MQSTRDILLEATFKEIYQHGYQGTSLSKIMTSCQLTKGALYHYFKSKKEISLEMIEVSLGGLIENYWEKPIADTQTPFSTLLERIENFPSVNIFGEAFLDVKHGCLLNNLIQEMAPLDDDFSNLLQTIYSRFENAVLLALEKAQTLGELDAEVNIKDSAMYITASIEACITTAKLKNDINYYYLCVGQLKRYIESLQFENKNFSK